jgi:hypothetical protein
MCNFFTFFSDGEGHIKFVAPEIVAQIMVSGNPKKYDNFSSHTTQAEILQISEDKFNKWEYDVWTKKLTLDTKNSEDDTELVLDAVNEYLRGKDLQVLSTLFSQNSKSGGDMSTLTGGYGSTLTGGDMSTLTGGDGSTLTGGDRSTLTGGYGSTLTGGYGSTLTGGDGSTLEAGKNSVIINRWYDYQSEEWRMITKLITDDIAGRTFKSDGENFTEIIEEN